MQQTPAYALLCTRARVTQTPYSKSSPVRPEKKRVGSAMACSGNAAFDFVRAAPYRSSAPELLSQVLECREHQLIVGAHQRRPASALTTEPSLCANSTIMFASAWTADSTDSAAAAWWKIW